MPTFLSVSRLSFPAWRSRFFPVALAVWLALGAVVMLSSCGGENKEEIPAQKVIGIINPSNGLEPAVDGFFRGMAERGWESGRTATFLYEGPLGGVDRIDQVVADMKARGVDLVYAMTTPGTRKVKAALADSGIPVVFAHVFSPDTSKIVDSLSHPGKAITGIRGRGASAKALEWLKAVLPDCDKVFIPFHHTEDAARLSVADLQEAAGKFGVELILAEIASADDLTRVLADIPADADAVWLTHSHLLFSHVENMVRAATDRRIPVVSSTSQYDRGVMLSYGEDNFHLGRQVSRLADRILKGAAAADMPVENAEYFLGVNLVVAQKIGVTIPEPVLRQADFIVR